jgi:hypothetical protein
MTNAGRREAIGEDLDSQSGSIGAYRCVEQSAKIELSKAP